jgi:hypothetical protein
LSSVRLKPFCICIGLRAIVASPPPPRMQWYQ